MSRPGAALCAILFCFGATGAFGQEGIVDKTILRRWETVPVPEKTPFDDDAEKRKRYLAKYRDGYVWAKGDHFWCPTNPSATNLYAIRGWVEGWQAGVKAGGHEPLPAKYGEYMIWNEERK